jgi:Ankyrin repeats (3 copies)
VARLFIEEYHFNVNKIDKKGRTPLCVAVNSDDDVGMIRFLLEHGAHVNATRHNGESILDVAIDSLNLNVVRVVLFEYGADPMITRGPINHEQDLVRNFPPMTNKLTAQGDEEILRMLLE